MNRSCVDQLQVRKTEPDDLETIQDIRCHPLVAPEQYRLQHSYAAARWMVILNSDAVGTSRFIWSYSTILVETKVAGYISEFQTCSKKRDSVSLGWNLHPDYWGRGIMTAALLRRIPELFAESECDEIVADCFSQNERCLRVLQKLNFQHAGIGLAERTLIWLFYRCPHRIVRHRVSVHDWSAPANAG